MRKTRFTEFPIVKILKASEGGRAVTGICREHGMSRATFYKWKPKCGGMEASDIRRSPSPVACAYEERRM